MMALSREPRDGKGAMRYFRPGLVGVVIAAALSLPTNAAPSPAVSPPPALALVLIDRDESPRANAFNVLTSDRLQDKLNDEPGAHL